jgi:Tol biopolymer transport system component
MFNAGICLALITVGCGMAPPTIDPTVFGEAEMQLVATSPATDLEPKWAPDSKRLGFASDRDGGWTVIIADADGGNERELTPAMSFAHSMWWSPDGDEIVVSAGVENQSEIFLYRVSIEDGAMRQISTGPIDGAPCWSPNGESIAFVSNRSGSFDIWVVPAEGGEAKRLTSSPELDHSPRWSPDGSKIAFHSRRTGNSDIFVMPAEGGDAERLTHGAATDQYPSWSPDGRWVLFHSNKGGRYNLWVVPAHGGEPLQITNQGDNCVRPSWSPDGRHIAFSSDRGGQMNIWRLSAG